MFFQSVPVILVGQMIVILSLASATVRMDLWETTVEDVRWVWLSAGFTTVDCVKVLVHCSLCV